METAMITLPSTPGPRTVTPELLDFAVVQRPVTGSPPTYIDRGGMRYKAEYQYPPMDADTARIFVSRLNRARSEGVRVPFPLIGIDQSGAGSTQVSGTSSAGTTLYLKNGNPGHWIKEGHWLNIIDSGGTYFLHNAATNLTLSGSGTGTLSVWPAIRATISDGLSVEFTTPQIEGLVTSVISWPLGHTKLVTLGFTVEEAE